MLVYTITLAVLLALAAAAGDKKIELQDIEEDNLNSENNKDIDKTDSGPEASSSPLDFFKSGLLRYFETPQQQQQRYVQQYDVTEPPEKSIAAQKQQFPSAAATQAMVGYLSNVPMQIYLVPQYYNEQTEQASNNPGVHYTAPSAPAPRQQLYTTPEATQTQNNYVEVPTYGTPTGRAYVPQYTPTQYTPQYTQPQVTYVTYNPQATVTSASPHMAMVTGPPASQTHAQVVTYQMPVVPYTTAFVSQPTYPKSYYATSQMVEPNIEEVQENEIESPKEYATETEAPYTKTQEYPRYYSSRAPLREDHRHGTVQELPPPSPLILRGQPSHLSHIPKALPYYRPYSKAVYTPGAGVISNALTPRPSDAYGVPYRKRPTSLLDSYIPSGVQLEYLKRGYGKDPIAVYDALSGRQYSHPRHLERGFLPNQMYHTAAGGVTFGHFKRTPKAEKFTQK